jgi:hypothetical protein
MPYRYAKRFREQVPLSGQAVVHLLQGDCLIAGGCELCRQVADNDSDLPRVLNMERTREVWGPNRDELLGRWYRELDELGSPGWPCFAECLLDGMELPPVSRKWPERAQRLHRHVEWNLFALVEHLRLIRAEGPR